MTPKLANPQQFIDGEFSPGAGGPLDVENPYTEKTLATIEQSSVADVERAIAGARRAQEGPWATMPRADRRAALMRLADAIEARSDEILDLQIAETGMYRMLCEFVNINKALGWWREFAELAGREWDEPMRPLNWTTVLDAKYTGGWIFQEPAGVVSAIVPFNFPFFVTTAKAGAALAAGCSVVLKISELTPLTGSLIAECVAEAALPPGAFQYVIGGPDVGAAMVTHPEVDVVSFTGSTRTGGQIAAEAGRGIKKTVLELGGKSAAIILEDADLDAIMTDLVGSYAHGGQGCALTTRFVLRDEIADEVIERMRNFVPFLTAGDPAEATTTHSPQINAAARERILGLIDDGANSGAELVYGGTAIDDQPCGHWVAPTLFDRCPVNARIAQEEVFGPVVVVHRVSSDEEAIAVANDSDFGLWGAVFTQDLERGIRIARGVRTGCMGVNGEVVSMNAPFGGVKKSGIGREFGEWGVREFMEPKSVTWHA